MPRLPDAQQCVLDRLAAGETVLIRDVHPATFEVLRRREMITWSGSGGAESPLRLTDLGREPWRAVDDVPTDMFLVEAHYLAADGTWLGTYRRRKLSKAGAEAYAQLLLEGWEHVVRGHEADEVYSRPPASEVTIRQWFGHDWGYPRRVEAAGATADAA
ncbi:hypothetical protein V6N00_13115 [Tersicoccus sp. MR15.9]|uniref:hypothetical protein n=1 Tax=Tersicoccus mangrovi TaxID=3121635 RepID=UPI002FE523DC